MGSHPLHLPADWQHHGNILDFSLPFPATLLIHKGLPYAPSSPREACESAEQKKN